MLCPIGGNRWQGVLLAAVMMGLIVVVVVEVVCEISISVSLVVPVAVSEFRVLVLGKVEDIISTNFTL